MQMITFLSGHVNTTSLNHIHPLLEIYLNGKQLIPYSAFLRFYFNVDSS